MCCSSGQARLQTPVRPVARGARPAQRRLRHRLAGPVRLPGVTHPPQDPAGPPVQRPAARGGPAGPARVRLDSRGLRSRLHPAGE